MTLTFWVGNNTKLKRTKSYKKGGYACSNSIILTIKGLQLSKNPTTFTARLSSKTYIFSSSLL